MSVVDAMFDTTVIIKFWKDGPPLDQIYRDNVERWGVVGRFIMGLRENRTLLFRFENASDMLMALSRDLSYWGGCFQGLMLDILC